MWWWDRLIEEKIQTAQQQGYFDRLKGEGKPLGSDGGELAGENWLAYHLMNEAGVLPEWLSLRKDISALRPTAIRYLDEAEVRLQSLPLREWKTDARLRRLRTLYADSTRKLNLLIDQHNHRCPSIQHELVRLRDDAIDRAEHRIRRERVQHLIEAITDESGQ
jgi:hypothetical protein